MHRTFLGLTALLVINGLLLVKDTEGGRRRRCCNPGSAKSCCAPQTTYCAPRPTCCAPHPGLYFAVPTTRFNSTCLQTKMFDFGDGTSMYSAYCYSGASSCGDLMNMTMCSWDGTYSGTPPQACDDVSGCATPTAFEKGKSQGLKNKEVFTDEAGENGKLGADFTIVGGFWVQFTTSKQAPSEGAATPNLPVVVRLLAIRWNSPKSPLPANPPQFFYVGYEVNTATSTTTSIPSSKPEPSKVTGGPKESIRKITYNGQDYDVRLSLLEK